MKKKIAIIFISFVLLIGLTACGNSKPFSTIEKFTKAYNELDYNALIECYDPRIVDTVKSMAGGLGSLLGAPEMSDQDAATSLIADLLGEYAQEYWDEQGISCTMSAREISTEMTSDSKAKVTVEFTFDSSTGENETWEETLSMVKSDGKWYITIGLSDITSLF